MEKPPTKRNDPYGKLETNTLEKLTLLVNLKQTHWKN
jgi:hypothetical protein